MLARLRVLTAPHAPPPFFAKDGKHINLVARARERTDRRRGQPRGGRGAPTMPLALLQTTLLLTSGFVVQPLQPARAAAHPLLRPAARTPRANGGPQLLDLPNIDGTGAFRNVQEYPCDLDIKVIGSNEGPFVSDIRTLCAEITGQAEEDVAVRWRDKGKYRSITLSLHFENADQVYAVYAAVDRDPRVKYKL